MARTPTLPLEYLNMLAAFRATLTDADEQLVFEEAIAQDFRRHQYEEWLLQAKVSASSRIARLRTQDVLLGKLIAYVNATVG